MSSVCLEGSSSATPTQADKPRGLLGRMAGWAMNVLNRKLNRLAIQQMKLSPTDHVLEIGCGAGEALRLVLEETVCQQAAGVDCSPEMIEETAKKNPHAIRAGSLELKQGRVEELPWPDEIFTKVFAISNFHIWDSRLGGVEQIKRVLKPGGKFCLCLRRAREKPRWFDQPGVTTSELAEDVALFQDAGFEKVEQLEIPCRQPLVLIIATKS